MTDTSPEDDSTIWYILIAVIAAFIGKVIYDVYKKFTKNHHEIYFVMMGEPDCCNPNHDYNPNKKCEKYCMGRVLMKIIDRINLSKSSICVAMYNFTNHRLADCLLRAHRRGVKVRVIMDKSMSEGHENKSQAKRLSDNGK